MDVHHGNGTRTFSMKNPAVSFFIFTATVRAFTQAPARRMRQAVARVGPHAQCDNPLRTSRKDYHSRFTSAPGKAATRSSRIGTPQCGFDAHARTPSARSSRSGRLRHPYAGSAPVAKAHAKAGAVAWKGYHLDALASRCSAFELPDFWRELRETAKCSTETMSKIDALPV